MGTPCAGCKAKGSEEVKEAATFIAVGHKVWDMCEEHADRFAGYFADLFKDSGEAEAETGQRRNVVITGTIPGYAAANARTAVENLGYDISGHVNEHTAVIICGLRPAPHKVAEARELGTPCLDATKPKAFRDAVRAGAFSGGDELPDVKPKITAEDVLFSA